MPPELVDLAVRYARRPGLSATPLPELQIVRADRREARVYTVLRPSLCFILQGAKEVTVGSDVLRYRSQQFLFSSVDLPATGEVLEASPRQPYLGLMLQIEPGVVFELASASGRLERRATSASKPAIFVGSDGAMTDAFMRLLRCAQDPVDARILAPGVIREITYRLVCGPHGDVVSELGIADSQTQRIASAVEWLKRDYARPIRTAELARMARMSVSAFHHHFKKVTTLSPLQYQKRLRLHEARRLLLGDTTSAADAGFRVGYESPSQFNREYRRYFGLPPISDIKRVDPRQRGETTKTKL